jgi:hypothetical protein
MPRTAGAIASTTGNRLALSVSSASGQLGRFIDGSIALNLTVTNADLALLVLASGSATLTLTIGSVSLGAAINISGSTAASIAVSDATLGALAGMFANTSFSITPAGALTATGALAGNILPYTELSPQSLADAVWSALAASNNVAGTMGAEAQASSGVSTGSTFNHAATGFTLTAGTVTTGSYSVTAPRDGVTHRVASVDPNIDFIYDFQLDVNAIPTAVTMYASVTGNNDPVFVYGYDYTALAWLQIGTLNGTANTHFVEASFAMLSHMVSAAGLVRIRFAHAATTATAVETDQIFVAYGNTIVDANITKVNGYTVTGAGTSGSPWGPV